MSGKEQHGAGGAVRLLAVVADDYGIGPETSRAILELARAGVVTGTVLLVNSPFTEAAVKAWRTAVWPEADLGWHPCLTMDRPIAPPGDVPSLLGPDGCLWPLRRFLVRLLGGWIQPEHVYRELAAQLRRFRELTGEAPILVNAHQHVNLFGPVGAILRDVLRPLRQKVFLRRVVEPWATYSRVPGARVKRGVLALLGKKQSKQQVREGFAGPEWLLGITDPVWVQSPAFFDRWLSCVPGSVVELMCHPGHFDATLVGRDCWANDGLQQRRVDEYLLLRQPSFLESCRRAGFTLAPPSACFPRPGRGRHVA
jgi:predicted glycoside hydrolase/deacetylase ChbG (UPF0249 family)